MASRHVPSPVSARRQSLTQHLQEGAALRELGLSAYAGSFLHAPPLLNALLGALRRRRVLRVRA